MPTTNKQRKSFGKITHACQSTGGRLICQKVKNTIGEKADDCLYTKGFKLTTKTPVSAPLGSLLFCRRRQHAHYGSLYTKEPYMVASLTAGKCTKPTAAISNI